MTQNKELRQLENSLEIVGTLKSIDLEEKESKKGNWYVKGNLIVSCNIDDKIHDQRISVFIMKTSGLYKGIRTVMDEWKASDDVGKELAHRVRVNGELTLNQYINKNDKLVQFNEIKGVFFSRLKEEENDVNDPKYVKDKALASVEAVVEGFDNVLDSDKLPTGDFSVKAFTVAWGSTVVDLHNVIVKESLAEAFMDLYQPGNTGRLTLQLNNYVEIVDQPEEQPVAQTHGFGSSEVVESTVVDRYVNNIEVIGGDMPFLGSKEYTPEEIELATKTSQLAIQSLSAAPSTPQVPDTNTGFGAGTTTPDVSSQMPTGMSSDDEMPDF